MKIFCQKNAFFKKSSKYNSINLNMSVIVDNIQIFYLKHFSCFDYIYQINLGFRPDGKRKE